MTEGLIQTKTLSWVILQHLLYEVEQLVVVFILRHHVMLMGKQGGTIINQSIIMLIKSSLVLYEMYELQICK